MEKVDRQYTDLGILYMETRLKNGLFHGLQQFWHFTGEKVSRFFAIKDAGSEFVNSGI
jgi:hypothetical protein